MSTRLLDRYAARCADAVFRVTGMPVQGARSAPRDTGGQSRARRYTASHWLACLVLALVFAGCSAREVEKDLTITDVHTGWYDAGIVNGQNKLVPSISLKLQNVSPEEIARVQINAVFKRLDGENKEWDAHFVRGIGPDGLAPGAKGDELVLRSERGYTGDQSRLQMLQNKAFVDAKVEIFGKHGSRFWVKLGEFKIDRQLLTE